MPDQINQGEEWKRCKPVDPIVRDTITINDKVRADLQSAFRAALVCLGTAETARIAQPYIEVRAYNGMMGR